MKAREWEYLTGRAQLWFPVIFCVKVLAPRMPFVPGALSNVRINPRLMD